ncbi:helix-turn-helix domain-containing protein [Cognatishimia sp. D5M38]|uniref:Helix-turn-helix domain-containing protein n=1 Tax=Cognatishimia coralii TaxID=3083254 RepID=A0ABU8QHE8_9RHOB
MGHVETTYLKTAQAASFTGLSRSTLEKMRVNGIGPTYLKLSARCVLYSISDLTNWLNSHRQNSTSDNTSGRVPSPKAGNSHEETVHARNQRVASASNNEIEADTLGEDNV